MKTALALLGCALCSGAAGAARLAVELPAHAAVDGGAVTLGQVARLASGELDLMRSLVDLPVGRAPAPGRAAVVSRDALQRVLQRRGGLAPQDIAWSGAQAVEVGVPAVVVDGAAIAGVATGALARWLAGQAERHELQLQSVPRDVDAPAGPLELVARDLEGAALRSRMVVWVDVLSGGRFVRLVPVAFHVRAWRPVAVARAALPAGAAVPASAIERVDTDIAAHPQPAAVGAGQRTRHAIAAGAVIGAHDVERRPAVERGHWAVLRSGTGPVTAEARVEVLQDGRTGERVRVRAPGASASLLATVLGPGALEVAR